MDSGFPGELNVYSSYFLGGDNQLLMKWEASLVDAENGTETPINLTNHTYWNLSGDFAQPTVAEHTLELCANKILECDKHWTPTGVINDVEGTVFDFTTAQKVGDKDRLTGAIDAGGKPGIDHAFCVDEADPELSHAMHKVAKLECPKSGIKMQVSSTQPSVVVYTTNWVEAPSPDSKHRQHAAICLETCQYLDAINKTKF